MAVLAPPASAAAYEHVLNDLRKRRDELNIAIRALESVHGVSSMQSAPPASRADVTAKVDAARPSIADAGVEILRSNGSAMRSVDLVPAMQALGVKLTSADPNNTVNSVLSRRAGSVGDIVRAGRSTWGLKEWEQNPPAERPEPPQHESVSSTEAELVFQ